MNEPAPDRRPNPAGNAVAVAVSTLCATTLAATGTPIADALLLVAGAGTAGALSGRLSSGRPVREVIRNLLNSPS
ncbi:hypothetical protein ACFVGY_37570 [Streptomyces sp. NPDC127106]|uniref:hypothetical protein n=1 Tax=Streptomyces sp. NPDC127106 TaxID=3345360 RepID=UPI00362AAD3C